MCLEVKSIATQTHFARLSQRLKSMFFKRFYFFTLKFTYVEKAWSFKLDYFFQVFSSMCKVQFCESKFGKHFLLSKIVLFLNSK